MLAHDILPLRSFASWVVAELKMPKPRRTQRHTKEVMHLYTVPPTLRDNWNSYLDSVSSDRMRFRHHFASPNPERCDAPLKKKAAMAATTEGTAIT